MKKILIVEDNNSFASLLKQAISLQEEYEVIGIYDKGEDVTVAIQSNTPDLILMDVKLKGKMDGIQCTASIHKKYPHIDIIILSVFSDSETVFDALRFGACGYLTKNSSIQEIINAIKETINGGAPMSLKISRMVLDSFKKNLDSPLTKREDEVLNKLAKGGSYKTVAEQIEVSIETVKYHIKNIYIKLHVNTKEDAIKLARKNNWI